MIRVVALTPAGLRGGFDIEQWFTLPLKLRRRWWAETDYGKLPPTDELKAAIAHALRHHATSRSS